MLRPTDQATLDGLLGLYVQAKLNPDIIIGQIWHMVGMMRLSHQDQNDPSTSDVNRYIADHQSQIYNNSHRPPKP